MSGTVAIGALFLTFAGVALYRQSTFDDRWAKVHTGMSKEEVRQVLGDPEHIYPAGVMQSDSIAGTLVANWLFDSTREKWAYGRRRLIASQPTFPYFGVAFDGFLGPENDDHVVYFSKDGRVVKKQHPYRVGEASTPAP